MQREKYLVVGLGVTGLSVVEFLCSRGAEVVVTDDALEPSGLVTLREKFVHVAVFTGGIVVPAGITQIVLSPGVALNSAEIIAARARGIVVTGDVELFAREVRKPVLAITGSNGKSTVTTLVGEMARASGLNVGVGGNLGTPALSLLAMDYDYYVLELSSFQLELLESLHCVGATVLNVSPDHMDRYVDLQAYQAAKLKIYQHAEHAIINRQDLATTPSGVSVQNTITFGLDQPTGNNFGILQLAGQDYLAQGTQALLPVSELAMLGAHNVANALAALALGWVAGFDVAQMLQVLRVFTGLPHRCEKVVASAQVLWVNDSKGTNVAATVAALHGLAHAIPGKWIIILGGVGKNADFRPLLEPVQQYCRTAILLGSAKEELRLVLGQHVDCRLVNDLRQAIEVAHECTQSGDGVLLSPACASFDMFNNYMHRGDEFRRLVLARMADVGTATTG